MHCVKRGFGFFKFSVSLGFSSSHFGRNNERLLSGHLFSSTHHLFFEHYYMLLEMRRPGVTHSSQDTRAVQIMSFMSLFSPFLIIPAIYLVCFIREVTKRKLSNVECCFVKHSTNIEHCCHSSNCIDPRICFLTVNIYIH